MKKILALTVGGSCAPVVTAIQDHQPDFVLFIASKSSRVTVDGKDKPCKGNGEESRPNILEQTRLTGDRFDILELDEPDDLNMCYQKIRTAMQKYAAQEYANWRKIADYTGGTKTMTAALVVVSLELGWELSVVRGNRTDLIKVRDGTEMASLVNSAEVRARQQLNLVVLLLNQFAYASAGEVAENLLRTAPLSSELQNQIQGFVTLARGFDAWDRFDHARARQILEPYQAKIVPQWKFLKKLTKEDGRNYEMVWDLLLNARRRAMRGRYDDAVARLYRALELLAQVRLKQRTPSLDSSALDPTLLPENLQAKYEALREAGKNGKIRLGLRQDYELLVELGDPLGQVYQTYEKRLLKALESRNYSILAHGLSPVTAEQWEEIHHIATEFIQNGLNSLGVKIEAEQFPEFKGLLL